MIKYAFTFSLLASMVVSPALLYAQEVSNESLQISTTDCLIKPLAQLRRGSEDKSGRSDVLRVQNILKDEGFLKAAPNGYFGAGTQSALRAFQKKNKIATTGIAGPLTLKRINQIACKNGGEGTTTPSTSPTPKASTTPETNIVAPVSKEEPMINSFSFLTNSSGVQVYSANIQNVDAVSMRATCPQGIVELKNSVGLAKAKISSADSVCSKEKYVYLADTSGASRFDRVSTGLVFTDRGGLPSWFAFDVTTTPSITRVPVTVKACLRSTCVQKVYLLDVRDFFQTAPSTELGLTNLRIDESKKNILFTATNFNKITIRPGCPYNVQALDSAGNIMLEEATYCGIEKDLVPYKAEKTALYEKVGGDPIKDIGFNFEMKSVNGQVDPFSNVELTVRACSGVQADTVSSTTLQCVERMVPLPILKK